MRQTSEAIKDIVIVGGGTAGWMAAIMLSTVCGRGPQSPSVTLIESPDIPIIGVGEATVPPFLQFLKSNGIDERAFVQATQATFKLGIRFEDWLQKGKTYFHPFGDIGRSLDGHEFYALWLKCGADALSPLMAHAPAAVMAQQGRFVPPAQVSGSPVAGANYALHLDASLAAGFLRNTACDRGVRRIEATVDKVLQDKKGFIERLQLSDGTSVPGDLFVDCTGFKGLLIEETLKSGFEDWSDFLPCDRAVVAPTENLAGIPPYTVVRALNAGWKWTIPLQHRTGNGYVYSSQFCSDDEAREEFLASLGAPPTVEPRVIPFRTGVRKKIWSKNCLSLGLASGFLEPLESTAIHLVFKTLSHFIRNFPDSDFDPILQRAFHNNIYGEYRAVRDFLVLHYCTTQRKDTAFWRWCQTMPIPENLLERLEAFRARGLLLPPEHENLFGNNSWYAVLEGMSVRARKYHPLIDVLPADRLTQSLSSGEKAIAAFVEELPEHHAFIREYCPALAI
ncbi:tryptophan halogenase family protein [Microbulbifer sp. ALW1]|uniref:tryptophan halogenase family protein n=1 Tax=Microbulbifer sp. (strain ALW1) TaxID=1516059 RepID=UPI0013580463|nr:tryptophan halogenase family protein [Microbulbifer sp. ALW1]